MKIKKSARDSIKEVHASLVEVIKAIKASTKTNQGTTESEETATTTESN